MVTRSSSLSLDCGLCVSEANLMFDVLDFVFCFSNFTVLGISRGSSVEEVKDAYEKLSSKWYCVQFYLFQYDCFTSSV